MQQMSTSNYITMGDAARLLGVTKARISQLAASGTLACDIVGGRKMVQYDSAIGYQKVRKRGRRPAADVGRKFTLMSADHEVAHVSFDPTREFSFEIADILDARRMPFGTCSSSSPTVNKRALNTWWSHRSVPDVRPGLISRYRELGIDSGIEVPVRCLGFSLSDCYWLRPVDCDELNWQHLNYFENNFERSAPKHRSGWLEGIGLKNPDNTSEGELPKSWMIRNGVRILVKGCGMDDQRPFNEAVATALHRRLLSKGEFVPYTVERMFDGPVCLCDDFLNGREEYVPAAYIRDALGGQRGNSTYDRYCRFLGRHGADEATVRKSMSQMIVCDALLANSDRHWRNFGIIRNVDTLEMRPAPLFDSGNCLWYNVPTAVLIAGEFGFAAKPFGPDPSTQLAFADSLDWFDASHLDGFVDETVEILSQSAWATAGNRLKAIRRGLERRMIEVSAAVEVLRHVQR